MPYVVTVDQQHSRRSEDRVGAVLVRLAGTATLLPFERTVGDEFQGLLDDPLSVVDVILDLVRDGCWHIGVGAGPVEEPLPTSTRAARGPAYTLAREAVETAKHLPQHLAVRGVDEDGAADAQALLTLLAALVGDRSDAAWEAADLARTGLTATEIGRRLGVSRQAVGQRLGTALWRQEQDARPTAARLLATAAGLVAPARTAVSAQEGDPLPSTTPPTRTATTRPRGGRR